MSKHWLKSEITSQKSKLTIGLDASNLWVGGGRTHLVELLNAWNEISGYFEKVIIWGGKDTLALIPNRKWLVKRKSPEFYDIKRYWWQMFSLDNELSITGCDVLFSPGGMVARTLKPSVTMHRNSLPFEVKEAWRYRLSIRFFKLIILRILLLKSFKRADSVIFLSNYGIKSLTKSNPYLEKKSFLIRHGVNLRFQDLSRLSNLKSSASTYAPIKITYVSTIDVFKHQWIVIEALSSIRRELGLNIQLILVGGYYSDALKRLEIAIKKHDPNRIWVKYRGSISHSQIIKVYHDTDLGLFASSCENLPNILLEMMASGLPIACSDRGPMPEVLKNGGVYFNPEKADSIAHAVMSLLQSKKLRLIFAKRAQVEALNYSWKTTGLDTLKIIINTARKKSEIF